MRYLLILILIILASCKPDLSRQEIIDGINECKNEGLAPLLWSFGGSGIPHTVTCDLPKNVNRGI